MIGSRWSFAGLFLITFATLAYQARLHGAKNLTLEVRVSNRNAQALYQRFGMAPVGVRKRYYKDEDALVMWVHDIDSPEYRERLDEIAGMDFAAWIETGGTLTGASGEPSARSAASRLTQSEAHPHPRSWCHREQRRRVHHVADLPVDTDVLVQRRRKAYAARFTNVALLGTILPKRPGWKRHVAFGILALGLIQALTFVARWLFAEPVVMLFATRETSDEFRGLPEAVLEGLRDEDACELLRSAVPGPLDERVRDQIVAETRGNPLALLELPRGLSPAQLAGGFGLPAVMRDARSLSGRIEESFLRRLDAMPEETRLLLLVSAPTLTRGTVVDSDSTYKLSTKLNLVVKDCGDFSSGTPPRIPLNHISPSEPSRSSSGRSSRSLKRENCAARPSQP